MKLNDRRRSMNNGNRKRRKLKCSVKLFIVSVLLVISVGMLIKEQKQNQALAQKVGAITEANAKKKTQIETLKFERDFPQQSYAQKTNEQLEKEQQSPYLILQTDERYRDLHYGGGLRDTLDINGCAIASLTIVDSILKEALTEPTVVLDWAKDDYFTDGGTSWAIFPAFAKEFEYEFEDLGNNIENALRYLDAGNPVVVSAKPGYFTTVGHIMVLTDYTDGGIRLLDPNDNLRKQHSLTAYPVDEVKGEFMHYWGFKKS